MTALALHPVEAAAGCDLFEEGAARFYIAQLSVALGALHSRGMLYLDLKLENVMLSAKAPDRPDTTPIGAATRARGAVESAAP